MKNSETKGATGANDGTDCAGFPASGASAERAVCSPNTAELHAWAMDMLTRSLERDRSERERCAESPAYAVARALSRGAPVTVCRYLERGAIAAIETETGPVVLCDSDDTREKLLTAIVTKSPTP